MAALVKHLVLDHALNRLPVDLFVDLSMMIQVVLSSFTHEEQQYFRLYTAGFTAVEIARKYITTSDKIAAVLERQFQALETESGYTDQGFIRKIEQTKQYRKSGINKLRDLLQRESVDFMTHEVNE